MSGSLHSIRVLDLSRVLAGPWCTQNLADLGADVIKIERPLTGDDTRAWGPPYLKNEDGSDGTEAAYYLSVNRGKKSLTIDITQPEGQRIVKELVKKSDILVENYKVGGLEKYGLDYAALKLIHPGLIYCSITGFGQDGPYAARAGYDFIVEGMGGFMSITGERDGLPGAGPQKAGTAVADLMTGMYATIAVLAALNHRHQTGQGQHIDLALLDAQVAMVSQASVSYLTTGVAPQRAGNAAASIVPYQTFATADGHVIVGAGNDGQFQRLCALAGCAELGFDLRFATNHARVRNRDVLIPLLDAIMLRRGTHEWVEALEKVNVPCGPINRINEVFDNPQVIHRAMQIEMEHPTAGKVPLVANPMRFSATPVEYKLPPPLLGEHTDALLGELLGMSDEDVTRLRESQII